MAPSPVRKLAELCLTACNLYYPSTSTTPLSPSTLSQNLHKLRAATEALRRSPPKNLHRVASGRITKKKPSSPSPSRRVRRPLFQSPKGLPNPGNWCYRRSILQALLHTPAFVTFLTRPHAGCHAADVYTAGECIFCSLRQLAREYWQQNSSATRAGAVERFDKAFAKAVKSRAIPQRLNQDERNLLSRGVQSDAHEFFTVLTDLLDRVEFQNRPEFRTEGLFTLTSSVDSACPDCALPMNHPDSTLGLQVEIPSHTQHGAHLTELLAAARTNDFDNTCQSEACREAHMPERGRKQTRNLLADRAPPMLIVQLKRFQWNWAVDRGEKVKKRIIFDEDMELENFTRDGAPLNYKLYAIVAHAGESATAGHYISAVRHRDGKGDWSFVSDSEVYTFETASGMGDITLLRLGMTEFHPYLLFYQRVDE